MTKIIIENLILSGIHGATPAEHEKPQKFRIDVELEVDVPRAAESDQAEDTVDYRKVKKAIGGVIEGPCLNLIETLANRMTDKIVDLDTKIISCQIAVRKIEVWENGVPGVIVKKIRA
jgi:dihydroneopterin aldolase